MCGICGVVNIREPRTIDERLLGAMTQTLIHRGPDNDGYFVTERVGFGVRRLSIIDLPGGNQPMSNEDGTVHLICNGEIFNYLDLRRELIGRGHQFRSRSDVEVLVHLYEEEGQGLLGRLSGQFAFAIFDERRQSVLLARDQFGVLPLFYTVVDDTLIFASEIKAILLDPRVERRVDLTGLDQLLSLPGLVSPRTMFAGIQSLPPGHFLEVRNGSVRTAEYWDVPYPREADALYGRKEEDDLADLEERLLSSVEQRLQADVPAGAYLSGGLDSSLVTSMMRRVSREEMKTFSIAFEDPFFGEREYQALMVDHVKFPHRQIDYGAADVAACLPQVIWHGESPLKETYNAATFALSAAAQSDGVRVVLTGEGADELFAGYASYRFDAFRREQGNGRPVPSEERLLREKLWGDPDFHYETSQFAFRAVKQNLFSDTVNGRYGDFEFSQFGVIDRAKLEGLHPLHKRSYVDMKVRLADHLLSDAGDRMLLAHSVEGRFPFLDIGVLNSAARMPPDLKLRGFREKYVLRKIAARYVPGVIAEREKFPFAAPGSPQLLRLNPEWVEDLLSYETVARQGYFNPTEVQNLRKRYSAPDFMLNIPYEADLLLVVLTFGLFLQLFGMPDL
ncbi:MAG: asparagine synthase (glutamine-hydrolyzing) [Thermoanaerobaculia bacterium]|nr:asparagine synthase (glutamine-hydrolyzing) [Thermoanaerobaculia bacterium]